MTEYEKTIKEIAREKKNEVFYNSSESHAKVVLNSMVENAEEYVHIICGNMCTEISNNLEFVEIVEKFLSANPNRQFYVLFDEYKDCFLKTGIAKVFAEYQGQVIVRKFKDGAQLTYKGTRAHLAISDNRAFRLETNVDDKIAFGNFNDTVSVGIFNEVFDHYFLNEDYSEQINLTNAA